MNNEIKREKNNINNNINHQELKLEKMRLI